MQPLDAAASWSVSIASVTFQRFDGIWHYVARKDELVDVSVRKGRQNRTASLRFPLALVGVERIEGPMGH